MMVSRPPRAAPGPAGSLAWQEYRVRLAAGRTVRVAMSLADLRHRTMARLKKAHGALRLGQLVVLDDPESVEETML